MYLISKFKLQKLKAYLNNNLKKNFISFSHASFVLLILFVLKLNNDLRVCIDYRKLNALTKRNRYFIFLIKKTLTKIINCKYLIKLNVIVVFNKLRMHLNNVMIKHLTVWISDDFISFNIWDFNTLSLTSECVPIEFSFVYLRFLILFSVTCNYLFS